MTYPVRGVDVSRFQELYNDAGAIVKHMDMSVAKQKNPAFFWYRGTVGNYYLDGSMDWFYGWCKEYGWIHSPYHVVTAANTWQDQVAWFKKCWGNRKSTCGLIVDLEKKDGQPDLFTSNTQNIIKWADDFFGLATICYTGQGFANEYLLPWSGWSKHPLIVANYLTSNISLAADEPLGKPYMPTAWGNTPWDFWQWQADGDLKAPAWGSPAKSIDMEVFRGDAAAWAAWCKQYSNVGATVTPPVTPPVLTLDQRVSNLEEAATEAGWKANGWLL